MKDICNLGGENCRSEDNYYESPTNHPPTQEKLQVFSLKEIDKRKKNIIVDDFTSRFLVKRAGQDGKRWKTVLA
ncbi:hypothetical protein Pmani_016373 [Petrolisthes manimaculis]|uniref:Uncharacterized protein n=1 Tax=Petrolisthes manimaculis TaxID=1843537 RepID=A0AAE1PPS6_9EUCA|nr:hypothetical protein Pmani_016373 [Petrolisthes manimaculis]